MKLWPEDLTDSIFFFFLSRYPMTYKKPPMTFSRPSHARHCWPAAAGASRGVSLPSAKGQGRARTLPPPHRMQTPPHCLSPPTLQQGHLEGNPQAEQADGPVEGQTADGVTREGRAALQVALGASRAASWLVRETRALARYRNNWGRPPVRSQVAGPTVLAETQRRSRRHGKPAGGSLDGAGRSRAHVTVPHLACPSFTKSSRPDAGSTARWRSRRKY